MLSKRGPSFGYGTRVLFNSQAGSPSPCAYTPCFNFQTCKGKTFGLLLNASPRHSVPGPGTYSVVGQTGKHSLKYSLRPKTIYQGKVQGKLGATSKTPGPGAYRTLETVTKTGRQFVSRFGNSGAAVFSPPRSQRFFTPSKI